jgi:hypothetical protein
LITGTQLGSIGINHHLFLFSFQVKAAEKDIIIQAIRDNGPDSSELVIRKVTWDISYLFQVFGLPLYSDNIACVHTCGCQAKRCSTVGPLPVCVRSLCVP